MHRRIYTQNLHPVFRSIHNFQVEKLRLLVKSAVKLKKSKWY